MPKKILFAGPFVGEFGMELFTWQGHIRKMSREFDKTIVSSRPIYQFLYKDFCDEFVPYDPGSYNGDGYECIDRPPPPNIHDGYNATKVLRVIDLQSYLKNINGTPQEFIDYKSLKNAGYDIDICICARSFKQGAETKLERNWEIESCKRMVAMLLDSGYKVASVGMSNSATHIDGTKDMMNIDISTFANLLSFSKVLVGPSSGAIHFATLCKCPHVTWGSDHLAKRYQQEWNPFKTPVEYLVENEWNPSENKIFEAIKKIIGSQQ